MTTLSIATWNINSVRLRLPLVAKFLVQHTPDILCLQETKAHDDVFPLEELRALGYPHIAFAGQKSYNGVATLSKVPLSNTVCMDVLGNGEKRHIGVTLPDGTQLHNFYVPAGGDIPDTEQNPKFKDKLAFIDAMQSWSNALNPQTTRAIILGDFNIAPDEHDVWSHKQLLGVVSHTPVETNALNRLRDTGGWIDAARHLTPSPTKLYSWWSYRNRDWKASNRGRRLDHIWISPPLLPQLQDLTICPDWRDAAQPSDHVPVIIKLA
jgi:exodeoxyribonuclease-3